MHLKPRREPDLFESPPKRQLILRERREALVEILRALLTEALAQDASTPIRKEGRHEPNRG